MVSKEKYKQIISETAPKSKHLYTMLAAFLVGGAICMVGQFISDLLKMYLEYLDEATIASITSIIMIFIGAFLTGIGVYDDLGSFAGAGSIIPITGFANSIVSPAMEFKKEGVVFGIAAKMFVIAGPIIVFGVVASFISGLYSLLFL